MTWTRLDDGWSDNPLLEQLTYETRWHYLCLIQFCSRTSRYDGLVRPADARRCSDVANPAVAVTDLVNVGLLALVDGAVQVVQIEQHVPPPHLRDEKRKADQRERKQRGRLHKAGDHTYCLPESCEQMFSPVTSEVTRDVGTGQDGTGQDWTGREVEQSPPGDVTSKGALPEQECRFCHLPFVPERRTQIVHEVCPVAAVSA